MVQYAGRIGYALTDACNKKSETLEPLRGLHASFDPKETGMIFVDANFDSENPDSQRKPDLAFRYLVAWTSIQPITVGMYRVQKGETKLFEEGAQTTYILTPFTPPCIMQGHGPIGARFKISRAKCCVDASIDQMLWCEGEEIFSLETARANEEEKKGKKWSHEAKVINECHVEKKVFKRAMDVRVHLVRAEDRISRF